MNNYLLILIIFVLFNSIGLIITRIAVYILDLRLKEIDRRNKLKTNNDSDNNDFLADRNL